jgi:hypothetical protein
VGFGYADWGKERGGEWGVESGESEMDIEENRRRE